MAAKLLWDQTEKNGNMVFVSSKYCLDDLETSCQDYTQKYEKIAFVDICRRTIRPTFGKK